MTNIHSTRHGLHIMKVEKTFNLRIRKPKITKEIPFKIDGYRFGINMPYPCTVEFIVVLN